jgi:hypothetical protein
MDMTKLTVAKVLDREHEGVCQECDKQNLRWVLVLSDGSMVGVECARKLTGEAFTAKKVEWVAGAVEVASGIDCGATVVLYRRGNGAVIAVDGRPMMMGGMNAMKEQFAVLTR